MSSRLLLVTVLCCGVFLSCGNKSDKDSDLDKTAIIAIAGDADTFNPIFANSVTSSDVTGNVFPMMFDVSFDLREGELVYNPGLIGSWEMLSDGRDVLLHLRSDVRWEDGTPVSTRDVKFSYSLYGDNQLASPRRNYVESMIWTDGKFDVGKSIEIVDDTTMIFHFKRQYPLQFYHMNLSPIPYHIYKNVDRKSMHASPLNDKPIAAGPYRLERWSRQQEIVLVRNTKSLLPYPSKLDRVIFRVITEPITRLTELKKGTVDIMRPVYPENIEELQEGHPEIRLQTLPPNRYEYIGWANIDFEKYNLSEGKTIVPHPLFGDHRVRQALTYGIDRKNIVATQLGAYGELAVTDFSPIFRWAIKADLIPYPYDPQKARELLRMTGWMDTDGDGILDKDGKKFEFDLHYNVGNKRREYVATVVQENLKQLGIRVELKSVEPVVLFQNIGNKQYDAFIAGFRIGLAIDPSDRWGDITNPFNNTGFNHRRVTELLRLGLHVKKERDAGRFWKEIQAILHQQQPCTFLYWVKDVVAVNRRLKNTQINVLGTTDHMWDWMIGNPNSYMTY